MSAGVRVRPMGRSDIGEVAAIEASVSPEPWSVALFDGEFTVDPDTRQWLVAETAAQNGATRLIGFAGMMFVGTGRGGEGHLMNLAVDLEHRRQGVAAALCARLFDLAADRGFDALTLEVRVSNRGAVELYRRFGFAPVGIRTSYYTNGDGSKEDGLIMWLHDNIDRRAERWNGARHEHESR